MREEAGDRSDLQMSVSSAPNLYQSLHTGGTQILFGLLGSTCFTVFLKQFLNNLL